MLSIFILLSYQHLLNAHKKTTRPFSDKSLYLVCVFFEKMEMNETVQKVCLDYYKVSRYGPDAKKGSDKKVKPLRHFWRS